MCRRICNFSRSQSGVSVEDGGEGEGGGKVGSRNVGRGKGKGRWLVSYLFKKKIGKERKKREGVSSIHSGVLCLTHAAYTFFKGGGGREGEKEGEKEAR